MTNPESEFTTFDEMVLTGDLRHVESNQKLREQRRRLKAHFAHAAEQGLEEEEEPEED